MGAIAGATLTFGFTQTIVKGKGMAKFAPALLGGIVGYDLEAMMNTNDAFETKAMQFLIPATVASVLSTPFILFTNDDVTAISSSVGIAVMSWLGRKNLVRMAGVDVPNHVESTVGTFQHNPTVISTL